MKIKKILLTLTGLIIVVAVGIYAWKIFAPNSKSENNIKETTVKKISSTIVADGAVTAQNQAALHFQTAGKLNWLPLKEGDKVYKGQTIAQLDTYVLQKSLQIAANNYQTSLNNNTQASEENQTSVLEGKQRTSLDTYNKNSYNNVTEVQLISDTVKRLVDNSRLSQDSAQLSVDLANYAVQLASLTSPLSGIVTHEDVNVAGTNVTTSTAFTVADPESAVFRANVTENDIDYVSENANVVIAIADRKIKGMVEKTYPAKVTLANGQTVYQVDIQSDDLKKFKLDQSGTVLIESNAKNNATLLPVWTVLSNKYVWVDNKGEMQLKEVKTGRIHGSEIEILNGLSADDKVITDPKSMSDKKYLLL